MHHKLFRELDDLFYDFNEKYTIVNENLKQKKITLKDIKKAKKAMEEHDLKMKEIDEEINKLASEDDLVKIFKRIEDGEDFVFMYRYGEYVAIPFSFKKLILNL